MALLTWKSRAEVKAMSVGYSGVLEKEIMKLISKEGFPKPPKLCQLSVILFQRMLTHFFIILTSVYNNIYYLCDYLIYSYLLISLWEVSIFSLLMYPRNLVRCLSYGKNSINICRKNKIYSYFLWAFLDPFWDNMIF